MIELAEVFRRFAADYLSIHGASMLPSHQRAIDDILACRTAALGGQLWRCEACSTEVFSYHSCGNRSCPKCHTAQTQEWLERRQAELRRPLRLSRRSDQRANRRPRRSNRHSPIQGAQHRPPTNLPPDR